MNKNTDVDDATKRKVTIRKLYLFIGIVFFIWILSWLGVSCLFDGSEERGTFGDQFGAINALFSGLAFAGLIYTILLQHEELGLQRQELADTRDELKGQKEEAEKQNAIMRKQQFENTFFQLLQTHHEIIKMWSYLDNDRMIYGQSALKLYYKKFVAAYLGDSTGYLDSEMENDIKKICNFYGLAYQDWEEYGGVYFRNLYRTIKYIDEHTILSRIEKYEYVTLLRSQLSDYELALLFYNCLSFYGRGKFKPLIEKYALLHNLPERLLISGKNKQFYEKGAFESVII